MRFWNNLIGYQLVWFSTVIGAGRGLLWPGVLATAAFALWQLGASQQRIVELRLMALALVCGVVLDGALAVGGWAHYAIATPALPPGGAPLWILALWLAFALTLTQSLRYLQTRPLLATVFGAIGGPLAYLGAARGWSVVSFPAPSWHGLTTLALGWGTAMPLLATLARRWSHQSTISGHRLHRRCP